MKCLVPMSALLGSPNYLPGAVAIKAEVRAYNSRGWSTLSAPSTSFVYTATVPVKMAAPTSVIS